MGRIILWILLAIVFVISLIPCFALLQAANKHMKPAKPFPSYILTACFGIFAVVIALVSGLEFEAGIFTGMIFGAVVSTATAAVYIIGYFVWSALKKV